MTLVQGAGVQNESDGGIRWRRGCVALMEKFVRALDLLPRRFSRRFCKSIRAGMPDYLPRKFAQAAMRSLGES